MNHSTKLTLSRDDIQESLSYLMSGYVDPENPRVRVRWQDYDGIRNHFIVYVAVDTTADISRASWSDIINRTACRTYAFDVIDDDDYSFNPTEDAVDWVISQLMEDSQNEKQ